MQESKAKADSLKNPTPKPKKTESPKSAIFYYKESDNGKEINLALNETAYFMLASNPTTGYSW